jgi:integral membrane sensor domain MASE1
LPSTSTGIPIWGAAIIATGNTLEALVGANLLRRFGFDPRLARLRDVLLLVGLAALASPLISATFGVAAAALANLQRAESYPVFWAVWWLGDAMGDLLIAPLICVWALPIRLSRRPLRWLEGLLLLVALALVSMMVFRRLSGIRAVELIRGTYAIVPLLIWAALRFGSVGSRRAAPGRVIGDGTTSAGILRARTPHERPLMTDCYGGHRDRTLTLVAALEAARGDR